MDDGADPDSEIFTGVSPPSGRSHRWGQLPGWLIRQHYPHSLGSCQLIISSSGPRPPGVFICLSLRGAGAFSRDHHTLWPNFQPAPSALCLVSPRGLSPRIRGQCEAPLLIIPGPCPHVTQLFFAPVMVCNAACTVECTVLGSVCRHYCTAGCSHSLSANQSRSKHSGKPKSKLNLPFIAPYITHQTDLSNSNSRVSSPDPAISLAIKSGPGDSKIMFYVPKIHTFPFCSLLGHHMCCPPCLGSCRLFWVTTH